MRITKLDPPPLDFGWLPTFGDHYKLILPAGKKFHLTPRLAKPYLEYYINGMGVSTVSINDGIGNYPLDQQYKSTFLNPNFIQDSGGGKHWDQFTTQDAINAANYSWSVTGGFNTITSGAQEGRGGFPDGDPYAMNAQTNLNAYKQLDNRLSQLCESVGGKNFGCYDGIFYPNLSADISAFRTALSSDANALTYMKAHNYGPNPYFVEELWRYKHALLNQYFRSAINLHKRYFDLVGAIVLTRMALRAAGSDRKIMTFVFPGKTEFVSYSGEGYSERYQRQLSSGGQMFEFNFPDYSPSQQIDQAFCGLDLGDEYFGWEDQQLYGTNPNIVDTNLVRDDNFMLRGQVNSNLPTATRTVVYDPAHTYPYPSSPEGHADYGPCGAYLFQLATAYANGTSDWARHRTPGGSYCSTGSGYLADRLEGNQATARVARQGTRGWVKIVDNYMPYGDPRELEVDLGGGTSATFLIDSSANNLFLFDTSLS